MNIDNRLPALVDGPPPATIDDVLAVMEQIDLSLADGDGVKWFNRLYWKTTLAVRSGPPSTSWEDPAGLALLDVVFAAYYFQAVRDWYADPEHIARAWRPLFANRGSSGVTRIQFALCGMNAHINHDLPLALVETCRRLGSAPADGGALHHDYERVNGVLDVVETQVKQEFATGLVGIAADGLGRSGDAAAMWSIRSARETAWDNALVLWSLKDMPMLRNPFLMSLDRLVGLAGQGMVLPQIVG